MRTGLLAFLDHGDRHLTETFGYRRGAFEQLPHPDSAGESGRPCADDRDADLDPLVLGIAWSSNCFGEPERWWKVGRPHVIRAKRNPNQLRGNAQHFARLSRGAMLTDELGQLRDDLVEVAYDAEVGVLEDRRVGVLVDGNDHVRALHAHLVLDRARDADRNIETRGDRLAGLP